MKRPARKQSVLEKAFSEYWDLIAPEGSPDPVSELQFAPPREFRFDFAWPDYKLAVEIDGGIWSKGRHTRGSGFQKDCWKLNLATLNGWRILRYTATDLSERPVQVVEEVIQALGAKSH